MELRINGKVAELGNSLPAITKRGIDPSDLSVRFIDTTNKFKIPNSSINRRALGFPNVIAGDNSAFEKTFMVNLFDVSEIFSGIGFVTSANSKEISIQATSKEKKVIDLLAKRLKEISWDDDDIVLAATDISNNNTYDISNPFVWGKMNNHYSGSEAFSDQGASGTKYSRPQLNVNGVLNRLFSDSGYTFTPISKNLALTLNYADFKFTGYQKTLSETFVNILMTGFDTYDFSAVGMHSSFQIDSGTDNVCVRIRGYITATSELETRIEIKGYNKISTAYDSVAIIQLKKGTHYYDEITNQLGTGAGVFIRCTVYGTITFHDTLIYTVLSEKDSNLDLSTDPFNNYRIKLHENLKEETFIDLIKLCAFVDFSVFDIDVRNKTFSFYSLGGLNKLNSIDWSDKFIVDSENIDSTLKLAKKNLLKYNNDSSIDALLGSTYFENKKDYVSDEEDYLIMPYCASVDLKLTVFCFIAHCKVYNDTSRLNDNNINQRVLVVEDDRVLFTPISMSQLVSEKYQSLLNSLSNVRIITAEFDLKKTDVVNWKIQDLVYIDYFKSTFIVLEIANYIPRRTTKVKLLAYGR